MHVNKNRKNVVQISNLFLHISICVFPVTTCMVYVFLWQRQRGALGQYSHQGLFTAQAPIFGCCTASWHFWNDWEGSVWNRERDREVTVTLSQSDSQKRATLINELDTMISHQRQRDWQSLRWAVLYRLVGIRTEFEFEFPLGLKVGKCYSGTCLIQSILLILSACTVSVCV